MFLNNGLTYDSNSGNLDTRSVLNESMSYCSFLYETSLIETAIYDLSNRTATAQCQGFCGTINESVVGDAMGSAKTFISEKIAAFIEFLRKVINGIIGAFKRKNDDRQAWLNKNKGTILKADLKFAKIDKAVLPFLASATTPPTPSLDITPADLAGDQMSARKAIVQKLIGVNTADSLVNGEGCSDQLESLLKEKIWGTSKKSASTAKVMMTGLMLEKNRQYLMRITDRSDMLKDLESIKSQLEKSANSMKSGKNEEVTSQIANMRWAITVLNKVAVLHDQLSNGAYDLLKLIVSIEEKKAGGNNAN